jgi:uncharacterized protein YbaR (Trm112 family)
MAETLATQVLDEETISLLRCPVTGSRLQLAGDCLVGEVGGLRYPVRDGIPVLLSEEAALPIGFESLDAFRKRFAGR